MIDLLNSSSSEPVALSTPASIEKPARGMRNLLGKRNEHEVDSDGVRLTFSHMKRLLQRDR